VEGDRKNVRFSVASFQQIIVGLSNPWVSQSM